MSHNRLKVDKILIFFNEGNSVPYENVEICDDDDYFYVFEKYPETEQVGIDVYKVDTIEKYYMKLPLSEVYEE